MKTAEFNCWYVVLFLFMADSTESRAQAVVSFPQIESKSGASSFPPLLASSFPVFPLLGSTPP